MRYGVYKPVLIDTCLMLRRISPQLDWTHRNHLMKRLILCWFQLKIAYKKTCILLLIMSSYEIYFYINWLLLISCSLCSGIKQAPLSRSLQNLHHHFKIYLVPEEMYDTPVEPFWQDDFTGFGSFIFSWVPYKYIYSARCCINMIQTGICKIQEYVDRHLP